MLSAKRMKAVGLLAGTKSRGMSSARGSGCYSSVNGTGKNSQAHRTVRDRDNTTRLHRVGRSRCGEDVDGIRMTSGVGSGLLFSIGH